MFQHKEALFLQVVLTCNAADVHSIVETPFLCSARSKFLARQTSSHPSHPLGRVLIDRQLTRSRHFAATQVLLRRPVASSRPRVN